jgi:hypothetical protein
MPSSNGLRGREVLHDIAKTSLRDYNSLTSAEKTALVQDHDRAKLVDADPGTMRRSGKAAATFITTARKELDGLVRPLPLRCMIMPR